MIKRHQTGQPNMTLRFAAMGCAMIQISETVLRAKWLLVVVELMPNYQKAFVFVRTGREANK